LVDALSVGCGKGSGSRDGVDGGKTALWRQWLELEWDDGWEKVGDLRMKWKADLRLARVASRGGCGRRRGLVLDFRGAEIERGAPMGFFGRMPPRVFLGLVNVKAKLGVHLLIGRRLEKGISTRLTDSYSTVCRMFDPAPAGVQLIPARQLLRPSPITCKTWPATFSDRPTRGKPYSFFQAVQSGVERALAAPEEPL